MNEQVNAIFVLIEICKYNRRPSFQCERVKRESVLRLEMRQTVL